MKAALLKVHPIVWALLTIGLILMAVAIPGIAAENKRERDREIRVCEMSKVMDGVEISTAELLCAESWKR